MEIAMKNGIGRSGRSEDLAAFITMTGTIAGNLPARAACDYRVAIKVSSRGQRSIPISSSGLQTQDRL